MKIILIAAIGRNNELGKDNDLIWKIPEDMKFFREVTTGNTILMGRKTFESLPKLLKNRKHIVISKGDNFPEEVIVFKSICEFLEKYCYNDEDIYVIGGSSIYNFFIDICDEMYLTEINDSKEADVYFPVFDERDFDKVILSEHEYVFEDERFDYKHSLYLRKK